MTNLTERSIDSTRREVSKRLDTIKRSKLGQFMTPTPVADFMASLFKRWPKNTVLLDPGAGIGSLTEAFTEKFLVNASPNSTLDAHCFEIEPLMLDYLANHIHGIGNRLTKRGHAFKGIIHNRDFIAEANFQINLRGQRFTHAILNPPYKKISSNSEYRKLLSGVGIETVNLYTAFLGLVISMMKKNGEVVAIIPRSFCNGMYFRPFRKFLLERTAITHMHIFESRKHAFRDDEVLQENIIIHLVCGGIQDKVVISTSHDSSFKDFQSKEFLFTDIVKPEDSELYIHIPTVSLDQVPHLFTHTLDELGLMISTGPVVDFRVKEYWLNEPHGNYAPLLYAHHFRGGAFTWPKTHKKPNALRVCDETRKWLFPRGYYTLTRRFTSKEESRRLVAFVIDPNILQHEYYGFENHLNVFHCGKKGIEQEIAHGIKLFLSSTLVDQYFRNFSGHTQVNATDLRAMHYPSRSILTKMGKWAVQQQNLSQNEIDAFVENQGNS